MPTPITTLLNTPIPEKLWHYTSILGFREIVASRSIFATDVHFLNDREEFVHARTIVSEVLARTPEFDESRFLHKEFLAKAVLLGFDSGPIADTQVFVSSFSAAEDQLGQWRGYSHGSSGVSLGFDLKAFRPPADCDTLACFAPCVYSAAEKERLLLDALHHVKDEIVGYRERVFTIACEREPSRLTSPNKETVVREFLDANPELRAPAGDFQTAVTKTRVDCLRIAALLKNLAFQEENEWRLVLPTLLKQRTAMKNPPQFRVAKTTLVPYIAYPFPAAPLPLVDVILGPGSDESALFAAKTFLKSQGLEITPRLSKVPYRSA